MRDFMDERDFARFEFKTDSHRLGYIQLHTRWRPLPSVFALGALGTPAILFACLPDVECIRDRMQLKTVFECLSLYIHSVQTQYERCWHAVRAVGTPWARRGCAVTTHRTP